MYGIFGRSPTDGGDQHRKRISLAARRQERQGPKGALFDAEIGFVNGAIIMKCLRGSHISTWDFCEMFMNEMLTKVCMRRRTPALLAAVQTEEGRTRAQINRHTPIDVVAENRRKRRRGEDAPERWCGRGKKCTRSDCPEGSPERPSIFCPGCAQEQIGSGWYHLTCFAKSHSCALRPS